MTSLRPAPVELAIPADATAVHELRRLIEDWLDGQGIEQWGHGHVSRQEITEQIHAGQWHVVRDPAMGVAAAARLLWADPEVWGTGDIPAVYVHGLMVHRGAAGRGLGRLSWTGPRSVAGLKEQRSSGWTVWSRTRLCAPSITGRDSKR